MTLQQNDETEMKAFFDKAALFPVEAYCKHTQ